MSEAGKIRETYTKSGQPRYEIEISHSGLHKYKVIRGTSVAEVQNKAEAEMDRWDAQWAAEVAKEEKRKAAEEKARIVEEKKRQAQDKTRKAQELLRRLENTLEHTLTVDDRIDWDTLKVTTDYPVPKPGPPDLPPKPQAPQIPTEPKEGDPIYQLRGELLDKIVPGRRASRLEAAAQRFKEDHETWVQARAAEETRFARETALYQQRVGDLRRRHVAAVGEWKKKRAAFLKERDARNAKVDRLKALYMGGDLRIVPSYCDLVLKRSEYPDFFPKAFELDYNPETRILIVDYELPSPNAIPTVCEVRYDVAHDRFSEKQITERQLNSLYDNLLYQIALRTIHELYEADVIEALSVIVFNGYVRSVDPATGNETYACVFSIQAGRAEFLELNLAQIDPKACFKKLKGVGSSKLHSLTPVAPILEMDKQDKRFVSSYAVAEKLAEGENLAAMDWEDFEHLIRELFEKEFAEGGAEVRVTQASRDGGIDAVIFDPDPIRGGKIVVQAKRYTNTVGVSAVRDLYGTVLNEGANKGILVSTANYGPDAYEFARGKPLTLLSGNNLLHLLEKHGHKFRIDLKEAKRVLADKDGR